MNIKTNVSAIVAGLLLICANPIHAQDASPEKSILGGGIFIETFTGIAVIDEGPQCSTCSERYWDPSMEAGLKLGVLLRKGANTKRRFGLQLLMESGIYLLGKQPAYKANEAITGFYVHPVGVGFSGAFKFNETMGLETNLTASAGITIADNSYMGLRLNLGVKFRYKRLSVGLNGGYLLCRAIVQGSGQIASGGVTVGFKIHSW